MATENVLFWLQGHPCKVHNVPQCATTAPCVHDMHIHILMKWLRLGHSYASVENTNHHFSSIMKVQGGAPTCKFFYSAQDAIIASCVHDMQIQITVQSTLLNQIYLSRSRKTGMLDVDIKILYSTALGEMSIQ